MRIRRMSLCCLLLCYLFLCQRPLLAALPGADVRLPPGVGQDWLSHVQKQLADDEYSIQWQQELGGYAAPNRAQNLRFSFRSGGFTVKPRVTRLPLFDAGDTTIKEENKKYKELADWQISFDLHGYGKGDFATGFEARVLTVIRNAAEIGDEGLSLTYDNSRQGMRQNFIVKKRPVGDGYLQVGLNVVTDLGHEINPEGIVFRLADGQEVMQYNSLKVWDATGRELKASFRPIHQSCLMAIEVDDRDAIYPVTIDPISSTANWTAEGDQDNEKFGTAVSSAGDVNNDGYDDVVIGAPDYDNGQTGEGKVFVYHGSATGLASTPIWYKEINQVAAAFGYSVSSAGDVNNDGYDDVIVGAHGYDNVETDEGRVYVYHGSAAGLVFLASWTEEVNQASARFGYSVSSAGDVNNDGYNDVIIGTDGGLSYVYHGSASGLLDTANWWTPAGGTSVSSAGDVNHDGYDDVIVGNTKYESGGETDEGGVFVYHGSASGLSPAVNWSAEGNQDGSKFGYSVSSAGDVNNDGYDDVVIGAPDYDNDQTDEGQVYVYHGSSSGLSDTANWTAEGNQASANFGKSVSSAGDVNNDGYGDIIIGASGHDNDQTNEGKAFVYYGSAAGLPVNANWTAEGNQSNAFFGTQVSAAGDVNGDGFGDIMVGAEYFGTVGGNDAGKVFVYHGWADYTLTYLAGANGSLSGTTSQGVNHGQSGTAVSAVPAVGYHFEKWSDNSTNNPRTDSSVTGNITVTAMFSINSYAVTYAAGANGSITGNTLQTVSHGSSGTPVTAVPAAGYHFVRWSDNSTTNPRTDSNVTGNITVTATFGSGSGGSRYTLSYTAGANGSVSGETTQSVYVGDSGTAVTAVPAAGYHFVRWSDNSTTNPRTDSNVAGNITVTAIFGSGSGGARYTLTYLAGGNGAISGVTPQSVYAGDSGSAVTAVPATGYHFDKWNDGSTNNPRTDSAVVQNKTLTASFAINVYTLTYASGVGGTLVGDSSQSVMHGGSGTEVTAVADPEYHFVNWSDGSTDNPRIDSPVTGDVSVTARFKTGFPWPMFLPALMRQ